MNITISAKDFKLTPSIKEYVNEKMGKLAKFDQDIQRIGVELDVDHNVTKGIKNRIEVWVYLPGVTLEAGMKAEHMQEAVDLVYPIIERQIIKHKEKRRSMMARWKQE